MLLALLQVLAASLGSACDLGIRDDRVVEHHLVDDPFEEEGPAAVLAAIVEPRTAKERSDRAIISVGTPQIVVGLGIGPDVYAVHEQRQCSIGRGVECDRHVVQTSRGNRSRNHQVV